MAYKNKGDKFFYYKVHFNVLTFSIFPFVLSRQISRLNFSSRLCVFAVKRELTSGYMLLNHFSNTIFFTSENLLA